MLGPWGTAARASSGTPCHDATRHPCHGSFLEGFLLWSFTKRDPTSTIRVRRATTMTTPSHPWCLSARGSRRRCGRHAPILVVPLVGAPTASTTNLEPVVELCARTSVLAQVCCMQPPHPPRCHQGAGPSPVCASTCIASLIGRGD